LEWNLGLFEMKSRVIFYKDLNFGDVWNKQKNGAILGKEK
jgi:hypothetical protein